MNMMGPVAATRGDAYVDHPTLRGVEDSLKHLFNQDSDDCDLGRSLVVTHTLPMVPSLLAGYKTVIVPYSMHRPPETAVAVERLFNTLDPDMVIYTGGRTVAGQLDEATDLFLQVESRIGGHFRAAVGLERHALHTNQNFVHTVRDFGPVLRKSDHIVIVADALHSTRCLASFRRANEQAGLIPAEEFEHRALVDTYRRGSTAHCLDIPDNIASAAARLYVYDQAGEITLSPLQRQALENLYLRGIARQVSIANDRDHRRPAG